MKHFVMVCIVLFIPGWSGAGHKAAPPVLVLDAGGHTDAITGVVFTPDGGELISVSRDKTIRIWDVKTGEMLRVLRLPISRGRGGSLYAVALSADGQTLAVAGDGVREEINEITLLALASGRIRSVLKGHIDTVTKLAYTPDGKRLVSSSEDKTVRIWNVKTGECERLLEGHKRAIYDMALSPDGTRLVTGSSDATARIWSVETGALEKTLFDAFEGQYYQIHSVAWSPDGKTVATGSLDRCVRLWTPDGKVLRRIFPLDVGSNSLAFLPSSREMVVNATIGQVVDLDTDKVRANFTRHQHGSFMVKLSPDGALAATAGFHGEELSLWKTQNGIQLHRLGGKSRTAWSAGWAPHGPTVAWGNTGKSGVNNEAYPLEHAFNLVHLEFEPAAGIPFVRALTKHDSLLLQQVKGMVNVIQAEETISILDLPGSRCWTCFPGQSLAAVGGLKGGLRLFALPDGKVVRHYQGHTGDVRALAASPDGRYLLSAGQDQTLRIWTLEREVPLISLFFAGQEWIVWTPEGYYAASPGGENLMGWHVNNGPNQLASYYPAAQFRKSLYRPDVIKLLLKTGSVERALEIAGQARGQKTEATEVASVLPPRVYLTAPAKASATRESGLEVRARASSVGTHPVTALQLLIDGRPFTGQGGRFRVEFPRLGDVEASWSITLTPGKHRLTVRAESAVSSGLSDEVEVTYVDRDLAEKRPSLYILAVGISEYPSQLKLHFAAKDAQTLAKTFQDHSKLLFEKIEVKELTNQKATRREILKGITWLRKQMTQRDLAIVFLAGHGEMTDSGVFYFLPADVDPEDIAATGVPGEQIKTLLSAMPGRVMFLLDACHAGGFEKNRKRNVRPLTDDLIRDLAEEERGIIVMCAATGRQFALESEEHRQGMFTLALVEGLQGKARQVEGAVYLHQLDVYVTDRVRELSRGQQSPTTARPASMRSFPLSKPH